MDGNEAAAAVAHLASEVVAIYPITPASPMGELADAWSTRGRQNIWGQVPRVIELQSEGGAAGAVHGSLQTGALTTSFTASQGLLLMLPNMYKISGELLPAVLHVAARSVATHALSIFGDHSDVMACRQAGWAMLASASVQEAHDLALVAHAATLHTRVPQLHFFDGFRTSHELATILPLDAEDVRALLPEGPVAAFRQRRLDPAHPVIRGTAQNPDVFFQSREACNPTYDAVPSSVQAVMDAFADRTGRRYRLFDYVGAPDAERVMVLMGSGVGAAEEAVDRLVAKGEKVGLLKVRLYRPFSAAAMVAALPETVKAIAALDRTKEPGSVGEPLYQDVVTALAETWAGDRPPRVLGGRYGLSSKEFTPAMACASLAELDAAKPRRHFTVGINDDVGGTSLDVPAGDADEADDVYRAIFWGLGSDGTVGASKSNAKILVEQTDKFAQGYSVYDSRKAGAVTISHLRCSPRPIQSTYLITKAQLVACHQFHFLERLDILSAAEPGGTFLLNSPHGPDDVWAKLPSEVQEAIVAKGLKVFVVDAHGIAGEAGLGGRINTVMQVCFLALSGLVPKTEAVSHVCEAVAKVYGSRGESIVRRNQNAVESALSGLKAVTVPTEGVTSDLRRRPAVVGHAPPFVEEVTSVMLAGRGDELPVSALPADGTFPVGTARFERRGIARELPHWDADLCTECGLCPLVCPHAAIRYKVHRPETTQGAPASWSSVPTRVKGLRDGWNATFAVAPDDCTGCGVCADVCPARSKSIVKNKALMMRPKDEVIDDQRECWDFFVDLPEIDRSLVRTDTVKGSQLLQPLFEFSGACAGCGETPYVKLLSQLFGDRAVIANATGCSSIYGGNLPTTPWTTNAEGQGPAWANSLFEDNAEFGLGMRLAIDSNTRLARDLLTGLAPRVGPALVDELLAAEPVDEPGYAAQRALVTRLGVALQALGDDPDAQSLLPIAAMLVPRSVWIVGGDGWAYDIGFGGLDHVLASGEDVNLLVLDTEVYSNTGGQASKATPRGAVAKFAAGGKPSAKKDLGMLAALYSGVYVAQIAMGASPKQTVRAFVEAEAHKGPSLLIAYSQCIAHGIDMAKGMRRQKAAVDSAYWPLYRVKPDEDGGPSTMVIDSKSPKIKLRDYALEEGRYQVLHDSDPERAEALLAQAQADVDARWRAYKALAEGRS